MKKFKTGDIVQLKSGGPKMTVERVSLDLDSQYLCQWFSGSKLNSGWFPSDSIIKVEEEKE